MGRVCRRCFARLRWSMFARCWVSEDSGSPHCPDGKTHKT
jgi:hypothetical protein